MDPNNEDDGSSSSSKGDVKVSETEVPFEKTAETAVPTPRTSKFPAIPALASLPSRKDTIFADGETKDEEAFENDDEYQSKDVEMNQLEEVTPEDHPIPEVTTPGAVWVRGFAAPEAASVQSDYVEYDTLVVSTDETPTTQTPVEVQAVTDEDIARDILEETCEAHVLPLTEKEHVEKLEAQSKKPRWRNFVGGTMALLVAAIVVAVVVGLKAARGSNVNPNNSTDSVDLRFQTLRSLLLNHSISGPTALYNNYTPQYMALTWLATKDQAMIQPNETAFDIIKERFVMATLYFATHGVNWTNQCNFLSGDSICSWNANTSKQLGVNCDGDNLTQLLNLGTPMDTFFSDVLNLIDKDAHNALPLLL
jgi:hypothetical protein